MNLTMCEHVLRVAIVAPQERIDIVNASELRQQLLQLFDSGMINFVIDLSEVPFMDSSGMAVLVSILKRARQAGGDVKLVWPRIKAARRILHLTKFDRVFDIADTAEAALALF
ncbi:MAG: anti-sigma factor antagonist [Candidatus Roseilinea sp.]|nr:MAG: anti-sigma factor antagonist [Candidatus Roseilinea sp.]